MLDSYSYPESFAGAWSLAEREHYMPASFVSV
jgi:hypothetical protein